MLSVVKGGGQRQGEERGREREAHAPVREGRGVMGERHAVSRTCSMSLSHYGLTRLTKARYRTNCKARLKGFGQVW